MQEVREEEGCEQCEGTRSEGSWGKDHPRGRREEMAAMAGVTALRSSQEATFTRSSLLFFYLNEEERAASRREEEEGGKKHFRKVRRRPPSKIGRSGRYSDIVPLSIVISYDRRPTRSECESVHDPCPAWPNSPLLSSSSNQLGFSILLCFMFRYRVIVVVVVIVVELS